MLLRLLGPFIRWLIRLYIERLICLHFCKFKEAGSDFGYTHVHVLPNGAGATGLGHDDNVPSNDDPGKVTVSRDGEVEIGPETPATMALRKGYLATAYFHERRGGDCPEGFSSLTCRCGEEEVVVCYTTDWHVFEGWRLGNEWTNREGRHPSPYLDSRLVTDDEPGAIPCGSEFAVLGYVSDRVTDCAGFGGPGDGDNRLVGEARAAATAAAAKVTCAGPCARTEEEVFKGWECRPGSGGGPSFARAVVVVVVKCASR